MVAKRILVPIDFSSCSESALKLAVSLASGKPDVSLVVVHVVEPVVPTYDEELGVLEPETYPAVPYCIALLEKCIARDFPVFASCFGFQLAVLAMGGDIVRDERDFEMGSLPITLRSAAAGDYR